MAKGNHDDTNHDPDEDPIGGDHPEGSWDETMPDELPDGTVYEPGEEELAELPGESTLVQGGGSAEPAPAAPSAPKGKTRVFADRFEVVRELGAGGMGRVYVVRDRQIEGRQVALKVLHSRLSRNKRFRELFFQEIHAAQGFVSENVVQVRDTGQMKDGTLFLTMDLVEGESLDQMLARESSLSARHALEITRQILLALASGHEQGFVHRDVKPSNVMLAARVPKSDDNPFGVGVRLLDFGIAGLVAEVQEGQVVGTPRYMSPEQVQGQRLDARSDLFAVGIILYEMLSGSRPFDGRTPAEIHTAVLETKVSPLITRLERVPEATRKIVAKALQKDRAKRFQSAADFMKAIEKSDAFKEPKGVPAWVAGLLLLTGGAAAAEGYLIVEKDKLLENKQAKIDAMQGDQTLGVASAEQLKDEIRLDYENRLEERNGRISDLEDQLSAARLEASGKQQSLDLCTSDLVDAESERDFERSQRLELERRIAKLEEDNQSILDEQQRLRQNLDPGFQASKFFDDLVKKAAGTPREALQALENARSVGNVPIPFDEGRNHFAYVIESAAAIEVAEGHLGRFLEDPDAASLSSADKQVAYEALVQARQKIDDAARSANDFIEDAAPWLAFSLEAEGVGDGTETDPTGTPIEAAAVGTGDFLLGPAEGRLAAISALRDDVERRVKVLESVRDALNVRESDQLEAEQSRLASLGPDEDPVEALAYLRAMGPNALEGLVERVGMTYLRRVEQEGRVDAKALQGLPHLRDWSAYALEGGATLKGEGAQALRWMWAAHEWYGGRTLDARLQALVSEPIALETEEPHHAWQQELQLQFQLLRGRAENFSLPEGTLVFRNTWTRNGQTAWLLDRVSGGDGVWTITRQLFDSKGAPSRGEPQELSATFEDGALFIANDKVLDLFAQGEHVLVGVWHPQLEPGLPEAPWTKSMDRERFDNALADGIPCLIYRQGQAEYWHAPGLGLVRHNLEGSFEREIRYSTLLR